MIKIYGQPNTSAGRCYWLLEEIGLKYETVPLDMRSGAHKSPEYLKLNPNGKIPCLIDGDFVIWESVAINSYLCEKYKPSLLGNSITDRAKVNQWSIWSVVEYQKPMIDLLIQQMFVPEPRRDLQLMEKSIEKIKPLNELLDQALLGRNYLVEHEFTLADLNVASVAKLNAPLGINTAHLSSLSNWLSRVSSRSACKKVADMGKK